MTLNKDLITRVVFAVVFFGIVLRVLVPFFLDLIKSKLPGHKHEQDIDTLIKRKKETLKAQYGITSSGITPASSTTAPPTKEIEKLYQETQWGGGQFVKDIQSEITKKFSYKIAETKVNAFILLCEKRNYLNALSAESRADEVSIKNFLTTLLLLFVMLEEVRAKQFFIVEKVARSLSLTPHELALALQLKVLLTIAPKKNLKEERIFTEALVLNQYAEESVNEAADMIMKREANLWAKSPSMLFEELTLALSYASMLTPLPKLKNRKDIEGAFVVMGLPPTASMDEIKKTYKKIALQRHPDKIVSQKLPKGLEQKAIAKFNQIQEAYEVLTSSKK